MEERNAGQLGVCHLSVQCYTDTKTLPPYHLNGVPLRSAVYDDLMVETILFYIYVYMLVTSHLLTLKPLY